MEKKDVSVNSSSTSKDHVEEENPGLKKKPQNIRKGIVGFALLIIILLLLLLLSKCHASPNGPNDMEKGTIDFVQPPSDRDLQAEINEAVAKGMFNVFINTSIVFENGNSEGNLLIQNVESNKSPTVVEIYLNDNETLLYKSNVLPVGYKIEKAKLNQSLSKGTYDCIAYFNVIDENSHETKNKIGLPVQITIKN